MISMINKLIFIEIFFYLRLKKQKRCGAPFIFDNETTEVGNAIVSLKVELIEFKNFKSKRDIFHYDVIR